MCLLITQWYLIVTSHDFYDTTSHQPFHWLFKTFLRLSSKKTLKGHIIDPSRIHWLVCSTSPIASLIRSVGGLSKCFYQGLWLADLNAVVIGQSINRRGVAEEFPDHVTVSSSFSARFLYGFPYRFQREWTVPWSTRHPLDVVRVEAWNSLEKQ